MKTRHAVGSSLSWIIFLPLGPASCLAQATPATRCEGLASLKLEHAKIASATLVGAGKLKQLDRMSPEALAKLPAYCRVELVDTPSADSQIGAEVWLPVEWNGRYRGIGNGGFAGDIYFDQMAVALTDGYATSGTDTGHLGLDPSWALGHPEKVKDFGWRAIHDTAVETKAIIAAFYGKPAGHSYFTACSDGGREALMEAQRFPEDYDGILAGAPAYNWSALVSSDTADLQVLNASAAAYLPARKVPAIAAAVRAACHAQDGFVADPQSCKFEPETLACKSGDADSCLMPEQVNSLRTIYAAKVDAAGRKLFPGFLPGAEDAQGGWVGWITGEKPGEATAMMYFGMGYFRDFVHEQPEWSLASFRFAEDYALANKKTAAALNATETNLRPFLARHGKLVMYHGWNDPAIPALSTVDYYNGLVSTMGRQTVDDAVRLYMVPGMLHCDGGPGATGFGQGTPAPADAKHDAQHDVFTGLVDWVESGKAPGALTATGNGMTRPLCVYPAVVKYTAGDRKDATSFTCVEPHR